MAERSIRQASKGQSPASRSLSVLHSKILKRTAQVRFSFLEPGSVGSGNLQERVVLTCTARARAPYETCVLEVHNCHTFRSNLVFVS